MKRWTGPTGRRRLESQIAAFGMRGVWRGGIIVCGVLATATGPSTGQPAVAASTSQVEPAISEAPPSPESAMNCYQLVDGWIRRWTVTAAEPLALTGAAVTLRMNNRIVGRGRAFAKEGTDPTVLARATQEAMNEVERRRPVSADALGLAQRVSDAGEMAISLELSGALVPFEPVTYAEIELAVQAGREGIAARIDDRLSLMFPSAMILAGGSLADAACSAISEASGDPMLAIKTAAPSQPGNLRNTHNVRLYRFLVTHVAQPSAGSQPGFLFRAGRLIEQREIDATMIDAMRTGMAANLRTRVVSEVDSDGNEVFRVVGNYTASRGPATAKEASPTSSAIVAMALRHHATTLSVESPDRIDLEWLSGEVAKSVMRRQTPMSSVAAAAIVACMAPECARVGETRETFAPAFEVLLTAIDANGVWDPSVPLDRRGLVAYGLAREARRGGVYEQAEPFRSRANAAIGSILRETSPASIFANMPWMYLADRELRIGRPEDGLSRLTAFLAYRDSMWRSQMTVDDAGAEAPDLVGGFAFVDPRSPLPTASGVRTLPCFAAMLADAEATRPDERMPELVRVLRATRFLRQLAIDEWSGHSSLDPNTAVWGVRESLWDDTLDPETQAIALISVDEIWTALTAISKAATLPSGAAREAGVGQTEDPAEPDQK